MATPCFFHSDLDICTTSIDLSASEAHHAVKARRLGIGQEVRVLNGLGLLAVGYIDKVENRSVRIAIDSVVEKQRKRNFLVATAVPKRDRQKVMVDMLTQLGVSHIIPLECDHSITRFKSNMTAKWQRTALEACKQSHNPWLPEIGVEVGAKDLAETAAQRVVFADAEGEPLQAAVSAVDSPIVMIGPEGGFSNAEKAHFYDNAIKSVTLGCHILRVEAAAVAAAAQCL